MLKLKITQTIANICSLKRFHLLEHIADLPLLGKPTTDNPLTGNHEALTEL